MRQRFAIDALGAILHKLHRNRFAPFLFRTTGAKLRRDRTLAARATMTLRAFPESSQVVLQSF